jgi:hypothetical protein
MALSPRKINLFLAFNLPAAFLCGVRLHSIDANQAVTTVRHRWINQNPFRSMFWAVQGMAAELSTGALVMACIKEKNRPISMLVASNKATFTKKATGKIRFTCLDGQAIRNAVDRSVETGEGVSCWMRAEGRNAHNEVVAVFEFEWTIKPKDITLQSR